MWSIDDLAQQMRDAGLREDENLIIHSSYKSIGLVEGGPRGVVDAALDVIGHTANLMVPTFTYALPMWTIEPFDIKKSKARTGAIPEAVRNHEQALRSFHPTHSVAVIGPEAEQLVENHLQVSPLGDDSPFARMHQRGAKILMIGTHQDTNSSLHYCEVAARVPYLDVTFSDNQIFELAWFINENDQVEYTQIFEVPGCSRGFRIVEPMLREAGVLQDVRIGDAESQLLDMQALVITMTEALQRQPGLLLCNTQTCTLCPKRRAVVEKAFVTGA